MTYYCWYHCSMASAKQTLLCLAKLLALLQYSVNNAHVWPVVLLNVKHSDQSGLGFSCCRCVQCSIVLCSIVVALVCTHVGSICACAVVLHFSCTCCRHWYVCLYCCASHTYICVHVFIYNVHISKIIQVYRVTITEGYPSPSAWKRVSGGMLLEGDTAPTQVRTSIFKWILHSSMQTSV
jgi:hypothetical protein